MTFSNQSIAPVTASSAAEDNNDGQRRSIRNEELVDSTKQRKGRSNRPGVISITRVVAAHLSGRDDPTCGPPAGDVRPTSAISPRRLGGPFLQTFLVPDYHRLALSRTEFSSACERTSREAVHGDSNSISNYTNDVYRHLIVLFMLPYIFRSETMFEAVVLLLECLFSPVRSWYRVFLITQTIVLNLDQRARLNASVAEGKEGILLALLCHALRAIFPVHCNGPVISCGRCQILPNPGCLRSGFSPPRAGGGAPSSILRRGRKGTLLFGTMMLLLRICDIYLTPAVGGHLAMAVLLILLETWPDILLRRPYFRRILMLWLVLPIKGFSYEPICEEDEFRLLRLLPQSRSDDVPIQCEMIHETLESAPTCAAISYHWGNPSPEEMMEILINGSSFKVSPTIHSLLLAERGSKNEYRALVRDLDRSASSEDSATEFDRVYKLALEELEALVLNPWFKRAWIIQEVAVSLNLILRHGDDEVAWEPGALNILLLDNIRRQVREGDPLKLKNLMSLGLRFKATLPGDKVYALIGIAKEKHSSFLRPNLSRTGSLGVVVDDRVAQAVNKSSTILPALTEVPDNAPRRKMYSKEQWQALKTIIYQLYVDEGQTFSKVSEYLHEHHDFNPTKRQFDRRISEWGFEKNVKRSERRAILERLDSETHETGFGCIKIHGRKLDKAKIERWRKRVWATVTLGMKELEMVNVTVIKTPGFSTNPIGEENSISAKQNATDRESVEIRRGPVSIEQQWTVNPGALMDVIGSPAVTGLIGALTIQEFEDCDDVTLLDLSGSGAEDGQDNCDPMIIHESQSNMASEGDGKPYFSIVST
ncbi:uncharacterized protein PAC_16239 [Phialocephala subalpina]|uniref:Clr5 domain-containing protein n=1 Tax=Phialocephala subalpina TaxID=576137 RepID=A0A1L7XMU0_9HELO|nr:uncharacterized protein PAC_16239 [Phialocephala subalpina]